MDLAALLTDVGTVTKDGGCPGVWRRQPGVPASAEPLGPAMSGLVITVSDRCSAGTAVDRSGPLAVELLAGHGVLASTPVIVPDDPATVASTVRAAARDGVDVVVLTGGTGIGPRDRTPEALRGVLDREIPGIPEAIRAASRPRVAAADLSRAVAGVAGGTLVLALPGSTGGVRDGIAVAGPLIRYAVEVLRGADHAEGSVAPKDGPRWRGTHPMVKVRFYAAARQAAGDRDEQDLAAGSLGELTDALGRAHGERMVQVLTRCSFLVDGAAVQGRSAEVALPDGTTVDVLPPFAGG